MLSSWLSTAAFSPASITFSNIPYSQYAVYLYYYNNGTGLGQASISSSNTSYYFSTYSNGATPQNLTQTPNGENINPGVNASGYLLSDYAVWTGQTGSSLTAALATAEVGGAALPGSQAFRSSTKRRFTPTR